MLNKTFKTLGILMSVILVVYGIHKGLFFILEVNNQSLSFAYSIEKLYLYFSSFSLLLILILILVRRKNLDIVGNTFLLLTTIKLVIAYIIARPILAIDNKTNMMEKWNFFILFIVFLSIETIITIRLLNQKN